MNLHHVVARNIAAVNPLVPITIRVSTGYTTNADGSRVPAYATPLVRHAQLQALQYNEIQQMDGLNIQGERRKIYINGQVDGFVREDKKGGDLITTADGKVWMVAIVFEYWPDWCCAGITLQDGS